jgi:hypothetical protein
VSFALVAALVRLVAVEIVVISVAVQAAAVTAQVDLLLKVTRVPLVEEQPAVVDFEFDVIEV